MSADREHGEKLFHRHYHQIEHLIDAHATRKRLGADDHQELRSLVMLKIVQDDFAVLRGFRGRSTWTTYLRVVIQRVLLDYRDKRWGRWRPSAEARRLGPLAVELDRRINRDGLEPSEAIEELLVLGSRERTGELENLVQKIPRRFKRRLFSAEIILESFATTERADRRIETAELRSRASELSAALAGVLSELSEDERDLLEKRFADGFTIRGIADRGHHEVRPLYRRFERILRRVRQKLEDLGWSWAEIAEVLESGDFDLEAAFRRPQTTCADDAKASILDFSQGKIARRTSAAITRSTGRATRVIRVAKKTP